MTNHGKTLLMIAFEFPPSNGASVPRIESFYRYLKQWGWKVVVLTASEKAYQRLNNDYKDNEDDLIYRAFALDVPRHLSIKGKYLSSLERPDRWGLTWVPSALRLGKKLIKQYNPDVIWSSSPIPSAHHISGKLAKMTQIPWVADYRDPFHYMNGSAGAKLDKIHAQIDTFAIENAHKITFATEQVRQLYCDKYGDIVALKSSVIENGFDESNFEKLKTIKKSASPFDSEKFSLYYSGVLYSDGRNPLPIFRALSSLQNGGKISEANFELIFQGAGDGKDFQSSLHELGIEKLVKFVPPVPFLSALSNMMSCDALLLIQDEKFNKQIPGKLYEYLRSQKDILVKSPKSSATANLASSYQRAFCCNSEDEIIFCLNSIINMPGQAVNRDLETHNRENKARNLEKLLLSLLST